MFISNEIILSIFLFIHSIVSRTIDSNDDLSSSTEQISTNLLLGEELNPPVFVGPNEGTRLAVLTYGQSERIIKLRSNQTNGRFMLMEGEILPGEGPPIHIHTREDESFHVLDGELEFQIGDQILLAKAGQWIYAPIGIPHTFRNVHSTNARLEFVFTPGGIEHYFEEVSEVFRTRPMNWSNVANQVATKYGIQMLGIPNWNG